MEIKVISIRTLDPTCDPLLDLKVAAAVLRECMANKKEFTYTLCTRHKRTVTVGTRVEIPMAKPVATDEQNNVCVREIMSLNLID